MIIFSRIRQQSEVRGKHVSILFRVYVRKAKALRPELVSVIVQRVFALEVDSHVITFHNPQLPLQNVLHFSYNIYCKLIHAKYVS